MPYRYSKCLILAPLAPSPQVGSVADVLISDGVDAIGGRGLDGGGRSDRGPVAPPGGSQYGGDTRMRQELLLCVGNRFDSLSWPWMSAVVLWTARDGRVLLRRIAGGFGQASR